MPSMPRKSVLITDLDNTLFDWVTIWHRSFSAMLEDVLERTGVDPAELKAEIRSVHQRHGTSEYSFLLDEIPILQPYLRDRRASEAFRSSIEAFRTARRNTLALYPTVGETLLKIKGAGTLIIGYTESMAFYSNYRVRRLGLDGIFDFIYSPEDHDIPSGLSIEDIRKYPASNYEFEHTKHRHTPRGELKPNPRILLQIVETVGAEKSDCVYVGDSRFKDVAMARDAGLTDVWAKYGETQDTAEYDLLKEVTHWTDDDVRRESAIRQRDVEASFILDKTFSQLLDVISFQRHQRREGVDNHTIVEIWKKTVDVQQHFNEIGMRIRAIFATTVLAIFGAFGYLLDKTDLHAVFGDVIFRFAALIPLLGVLASRLFFFIDSVWYHRLLIGSVRHGIAIENEYSTRIPELGLTKKIGDSSPAPLKSRFYRLVAHLTVVDDRYKNDGKLHSDGKIEFFYNSIRYLFWCVFSFIL